MKFIDFQKAVYSDLRTLSEIKLVMRERDIKRLEVPYSDAILKTGPEERLGSHLSFNFERITQLGDLILAHLDPDSGGIGWWRAYEEVDRKTRVLISDYLVACTRAISQNLIEAKVFRLELDHVIDDLRRWLERGISPRSVRILPPHGPYEDLSYFRVSAYLVGIFRAFGSALDCLAGCIVGVGGLHTGIVRADLSTAMQELGKSANTSPRLSGLENALRGFETDSGPTSWLKWLIDMRNMLVHRGRRVLYWEMIRGDHGTVKDFLLHLPKAPELSDVEACISADGFIAPQLQVSHEIILDHLKESVHRYVTAVANELCLHWEERKNEPSIIRQPPKQWKKPTGIIQPPSFTGYLESMVTPGPVAEFGASDETLKRLRASKLNHIHGEDVGPSPSFWF